MNIKIKNAYENNLKKISLEIPLHKMTAITGRSGSGKSTLLKDIMAAWGLKNFTRYNTKTIKNELVLSDYIKADSVENMPQSIFIDTKCTVTNPFSTVASLSGILEDIRNLFTEFGDCFCPECGKAIIPYLSLIEEFAADVVCDEKCESAITYIELHGNIISKQFFDKNGKPLKTQSKSARYLTIHFRLDNANENIIRYFNKEYMCRIMAKKREWFDPLLFAQCDCGAVVPRINRKRISFHTLFGDGGGGCRICGGTGISISIDTSLLISDKHRSILDGGLQFVSEHGIKYTTITEKFLKAVAEKYNIDITLPIESLSEREWNLLMYGTSEPISFTDRVGGTKTLVFKGIAAYLCESFLKGKGKKALEPYCRKEICPSCGGLRFDQELCCFSLFGASLPEIISMTFEQIKIWCDNVKKNAPKSSIPYLERLSHKAQNFSRVACGHLSLYRSSNTLSGGEMQRIRLCSMLSSDLYDICYLLDEPSTGLHAQDIESLGDLLQEVCSRGNTIIMVEHNKNLLNYCDYYVDMGPEGGNGGGRILFADYAENIERYNTPTAYLLQNKHIIGETGERRKKQINQWIKLRDLRFNNLKDVSVDIPCGCFTTVCGVSGSGKSTFMKYGIYNEVTKFPQKYGFQGVNFLGQDTMQASSLSTIGTMTKMSDYIARYYSKESGQDKRFFMPNTPEGKCDKCKGKGVLFSDNNEMIGLCDKCKGKRYLPDILEIKIQGLNIHELLAAPFDELTEIVKEDKIARLAKMCVLLGVGYLSFDQPIKKLSKGEIQRIKLAGVLAEKQTKQLYLLDEPSKGLHMSDALKVVEAIRQITDLGNSVVAVEHNPEVIRNSDYTIEFGGTGENGGYLLYAGRPEEICNTPTSKMLADVPTGKKEKVISNDRKISIECHPERIDIEREKYYQLPQYKKLFEDAAVKAKENYLSVVIPNHIFFSKIRNSDIMMKAPLIQEIDFSEKARYDITLYTVLGIKDLCIRETYRRYPKQAELLRYVFDEESPTGKCWKCRGQGSIDAVKENYFIGDDMLSRHCVSFLNNSTHFKEIKKIIKKKQNVDFSLPISKLTASERQTLFNGTEEWFDINGRSVKWDGIISNFLDQHSYYPDKNAEAIFNSRQHIKCPFCAGNRVKQEYDSYDVWGLRYAELMSLPIKELLERLKKSEACGYDLQQFVDILGILSDLGQENLILSQSIKMLNSIQAAEIKLISYYFHSIYGACLVLSGLNALEQSEKEYIITLSKKIKYNTIVSV